MKLSKNIQGFFVYFMENETDKTGKFQGFLPNAGSLK